LSFGAQVLFQGLLIYWDEECYGRALIGYDIFVLFFAHPAQDFTRPVAQFANAHLRHRLTSIMVVATNVVTTIVQRFPSGVNRQKQASG
jgi:hypothetical protein